MTAEAKPTGSFTDDGGTLRCRATGKRCLGHRQAAELAARARHRGEQPELLHCSACSAWHYQTFKVGKVRRRRLPRRQARSW